MVGNSNYIVQYVGFKTILDSLEFIKSWTPFANSFKSVGIISIDLYQVKENENLSFISRNIWDDKTYFKNFPSGIAGAGGGGRISVIQLGGYWIEPEQLESQEIMTLVFLTSEVANAKQIARLSCSDKIPYKQMLDILPNTKSNFPNQINCKHLKQM